LTEVRKSVGFDSLVDSRQVMFSLSFVILVVLRWSV